MTSESSRIATPQFDTQVAGIAGLAEPQRLALYQLVAGADGSVSRDEAAQALGMSKSVAAFHLDRLQSDGLLEAEFKRPEGKGGPGAGRPAKRYRRSAREFAVSLPERRYAFAGRLMAGAIARAQRESIPIADALRDAAAAAGHALGIDARQRAGSVAGRPEVTDAIESVLDDFGYEAVRADGKISLANCPFRALADQDTELVCGMNLDFIRGLLAEVNDGHLTAQLEPAPEHCCVTIAGV